MNIRGFLLFLGMGVGLVFHGHEEYSILSRAKLEPEVVELAALEKGTLPSNDHVKIGRHLRVYPKLVYTIRKKKGDTSPTTGSTSIEEAYIPIISEDHPYVAKFAEYQKQKSLTPGLKIDPPILEDFKVLVISGAIGSVGEIPEDIEEYTDVQGLMVGAGHVPLTMLRQNFMVMDFSKMLVLEQGRKPSSTTYSLMVMVAGVVLILISFLFLFVRR